MPDPDPTTEEMRAVQRERAAEERERAEDSPTEADERAHERRAAKADYLAEKLAEQAEADAE
ncbi:MAG: hypothetical protein QOI98_2316 [Solirubrobacteraceae bacterium]|jgi:hypothetical protein|nr:hypothetical protein [Solirubrobacteraceae bacterium]